MGATSTYQSSASSTLNSEITEICGNINRCIDEGNLTDSERKSILLGFVLNDDHVDKFHSLLSEQYEIPSMSLIKKSNQFSMVNELQFHARNKPHLQILHSCSDLCTNCSNAHWVCCYYDTKAIFIYDSKNVKVLHPSNISFLKKFFHPYFTELPIYFQPVHSQTNVKDSAVFAIAFATSIYFHKSPANVSYSIGNLRPHLYNMFQGNELSPFCTEKKNSGSINSFKMPLEIFPNKKIDSRKSINVDDNSDNSCIIENNLWGLERNKILKGQWLTDFSVIKFHSLLAKFSNLKPRDTLLVTNLLKNRKLMHQKSSRIEPIPRNQTHLQVIHTSNHWICIYFDTKQIFVYNSLHREELKKEEQLMLEALFPYFNELSVVYPVVQQQPNFSDCAIYAIAFATTIFFNDDPKKMVYDYHDNKMRRHLLHMFESDSITPFPRIVNNTANTMNTNQNDQKVSANSIAKSEWILRGLPNPDGHSCYANSVVQSIFHSSIIRQKLMDSSETNALKTLFNQYVNNGNVNTRAPRTFAGGDFAPKKFSLLNQQQCPVEFFECLCEK